MDRRSRSHFCRPSLSATTCNWQPGNSSCRRAGDFPEFYRVNEVILRCPAGPRCDWRSLTDIPYSLKARGPRGRAKRPHTKQRIFLMVAFLRWVRSIVVGTLNGVAMFVLFVILAFAALTGIGLAWGDGMPGKIL